MARRFITLFLIVIMVVDLCGIETKVSGNTENGEIDYSKCVLFAQQDVESIVINTGYLSINGDIISGGNSIINARGKNINGQIFDNQEIAMLRLLPNIERQYLDGSDYYNEFISEAFNENINKSKYVSDSFICENTLSVNNSAIVVGGDIVVKNPVTNMNNAIICSIIGDISIDSANISANGIIYAPMGTVRISGDNVNVSGSIIAQKIEINGRYNVNINKNSTVLSGLMTEVSSAVKYGEEDTNIIDIGEVYCKNFNVENDIVYAGDGIYCVKNQLLLSVKEEVSLEQVSELVNEFGASIVGFIELTNDF